jgi:hypothetical protein
MGTRGEYMNMNMVDRVKWGEHAPLSPSASWAENTIVPECTQESGHLGHLSLLKWEI